MKQHLENITENEVEAIRLALIEAQFLYKAAPIPSDNMDYALRIIEHRSRGQAENDRRYMESFAADCARYGSD